MQPVSINTYIPIILRNPSCTKAHIQTLRSDCFSGWQTYQIRLGILYPETLHLKSTNISSEDNYWENDPICLKLALRVSFEKGFNSLIARIGLLWPLFQRDMIVDASFWKPYYFNDSTSLLSIYKWKKKCKKELFVNFKINFI